MTEPAGPLGVAGQGRTVAGGALPAPVGVVNLANALTLLRLLLVPVFGVLLLGGSGDLAARIGAALVFVLASITDQIDGHVARSRQLVTDVGVIADPIADKALTGTALVGLSVLGELPWWVTLVILVREVAVTGLRLAVLRQAVIPASRGGKAKTLAQVLAITLYVAPLPAAVAPVAAVLMGVAVVLTVVTGVDYLVRVLRLSRATPGAAAEAPGGARGIADRGHATPGERG